MSKKTKKRSTAAPAAHHLSTFASVFQYGRDRVTIADWMQAWRIAESPVMPRTYPLMEVYDMVCIDAEVITAINNRKNKVLGEPFLVLDPDGNYQEAATKKLRGSWFDDFINAVLDAEFFGYSLIEIGQALNEDDYSIKEINTVERRNIIPGRKLVLPYPFSAYGEGIDFSADYLRRWYIFCYSKRFPLGLLLYAAPYAILSRDALIKHADFNRDYGKPYKIVHTDKEGEERREVLDALLNVEEELNGVFDIEEKVEIAFPSGGGGTVDTFDKMDEKASKKLLKIIQGHVKLSNDTEGGAQTYMNKDSIAKTPSEEIREYDMARVEAVVNEELFPRLLDFNYPLAGHSFVFLDTHLRELQRQKKSISETALTLALNHFEVSPAEFEKATGIKVKKKATLPIDQNVKTVIKKKEATSDEGATDTSIATEPKTEASQETGNQVDSASNLDTNVEVAKNQDFFKYGAVTLPMRDKKLWAGLLPNIDVNDLYICPKAGVYGYEDTPHITALYGVHALPNALKKVEALLSSAKKQIEIQLTAISVFEQKDKDYEVLKFEVISPALVALHEALKAELKHTLVHETYQPHATIAFIKKGRAKKYTTAKIEQPIKLSLNEAIYSDGRGNKTLIKFAK
ncbi:2'-5' RNA ligase family protein [uncultured Microscilla sp.]|uniref:phage portal protein family protein n=1 Tax=uncultured Microscilla sp. TaxID=432653 RepID=UPI00261BACEC|nr:2'-5' RNA ligase family protein [uncultured Microscilla sp.]